jgi:hypothetical protein
MGTTLIPGPGGMWYPRNVQQRIYPPNEFNACLEDEARVWGHISNCGGLTALCPGAKYAEPPWVKMPPQGKRFSKINSIPLPAADGAEHLVTSFYVPTGYDGCIVSVVNSYTGTGFAEGSGDLTWRIRLNQRYVKDYGAITTSIGSLTTPYNVNSGQIIIQSRQLVQYFVNRSVGSAGNLNGGRVICALFGWFWPR